MSREFDLPLCALYFQESSAVISLLDVAPTILDWFNIPMPRSYDYFTSESGLASSREPVIGVGRSLLPILKSEPCPGSGWDEVFASQTLHEVTMYYPMRAIRTRQYRLIHNMAYRMPFPIDQDFYASPTFQDVLARTHLNKSLPWFTTLHDYYYRSSLELYDVVNDPEERKNLADDSQYRTLTELLSKQLLAWQNSTNDPWICAQNSVIVQTPGMADHCGPLFNDL